MKNLTGDIIALTCVIFAPFIFLLNFLVAISINTHTLLKLGSVALIFLIIFLVNSIVVIMKTDRIKFLTKKKTLLTVSCIVYTLCSFIVNLIAWSLKSEDSGALWNLYTIITLACFSVVISAIFVYFKSNNIVAKATLYFLATIIPFILITAVISDIFTGAKIFVPLSIYFVIYVAYVTTVLIINGKKLRKESDEKPYEDVYK